MKTQAIKPFEAYCRIQEAIHSFQRPLRPFVPAQRKLSGKDAAEVNAVVLVPSLIAYPPDLVLAEEPSEVVVVQEHIDREPTVSAIASLEFLYQVTKAPLFVVADSGPRSARGVLPRLAEISDRVLAASSYLREECNAGRLQPWLSFTDEERKRVTLIPRNLLSRGAREEAGESETIALTELTAG